MRAIRNLDEDDDDCFTTRFLDNILAPIRPFTFVPHELCSTINMLVRQLDRTNITTMTFRLLFLFFTILVVNVHGAIFRLGTVITMVSNDGKKIYLAGAMKLSGMILAVNDFNQRYGQANNITVKYAVRDGHDTFMTTAIATASLQTTALTKWGGIQAIMGGGSDVRGKAIAETSAEFALPQVAYGASSSDFSHASQFPYFARSASH